MADREQPKFYLVQADMLPEIFLKVAETKRMLSTGEVSTVNEATKRMGISRSAFYKYRDAILPFQNMMKGRIITFQLMLHDEPGVLSALLMVFAKEKANVLTINSIIPTNGHALVTISAELTDVAVSLEELLAELGNTPGVIKAEIIAG
jgi:chorismate mutase